MWKDLEEKLAKKNRQWKPSNYLPYRYAELFCIDCGKSLGIYDIAYTDLDSAKYCSECLHKRIKIQTVPFELPCGTIIEDMGTIVVIEYKNNYYNTLTTQKTCYFNNKGRYIKVKGKRYYI